MICPVCRGEGKSSQHLGVVVRDDFDDEEWQQYLAGGYDARCDPCGGSGKVREDDQPVVALMPDGSRRGFYDEDDASEARGMAMMGWGG